MLEIGHGWKLLKGNTSAKRIKFDSKSFVELLPDETNKDSKDMVSSECNRVADVETENRTKDKKKKKTNADEQLQQHDGSENRPNSGALLEDKDAKSKKRKKDKDDSACDLKT